MIGVYSTESNGRVAGLSGLAKNKIVRALCRAELRGVGTENSRNNAWNVRLSDGYLNNNNKSNSNVVRAVAALDEEYMAGWIAALADCERHKRSSRGRVAYRLQWDTDLLRLAREVRERTYTPSESECFLVTFPRLREVFAANFRDRVVQHWLCLRLEPLLEAHFVEQGNVSYNCRRGFGSLRFIAEAGKAAERISEGYTSEAWYARFDIKGFFMAIPKERLLRRLLAFIGERWSRWQGTSYEGDLPAVLYLAEVIVLHRPELLCRMKGNTKQWSELPAGKSLFTGDGTRGMAIGNLTSQLLANFFLSAWDEVAVRLARKVGGWYGRFVDDFLFVVPRKEDALHLHRIAQGYLADALGLQLHPDKVYIQPVKKGVTLTGAVLMPGRTYLQNRTVKGFRRSLEALERACRREDRTMMTVYERSVNSYMGFLRQHSTYAIRRSTFAHTHDAFWRYYNIQGRFLFIKRKAK